MNFERCAAFALLLSLVPLASEARGFAGGGGGRGFSGGGGFAGGGGARSSGGFDFHNDAGGAQAHSYGASSGGYNHASTGPAGTSRDTSVSNTGGSYNRTTTATNGNYNRTTSAGASNGNYNRSSTASNGYATHNSSSSANSSTGNYSRTASGNSAYGSYNTSASGNTHNDTYNHSTTATNAYGQTYNGSVNASNGNVNVNRSGYPTNANYVTVVNPVYGSYAAWGWNAGAAWYPAPIYWGGGFWGPYALGVTSAAMYGSIVNANNQTVTSYQTQPDSPGAKLLSSYQLRQVPCGPPNLVVIYGPNDSAICAEPNNLVSAGTYTVNSTNLTIQSQKP